MMDPTRAEAPKEEEHRKFLLTQNMNEASKAHNIHGEEYIQPTISEGVKTSSKGLLDPNMEVEQNEHDDEAGIKSTEDVIQITQGTESQEKDNLIDLTDTDFSEDMLGKEIIRMVKNSIVRKEKRKTKRTAGKKRPVTNLERRKHTADQRTSKAYSRCSVPFFSEVAKCVCESNHRVQLVRASGFGFLLELDDCYVPRNFAQWIADNVNTQDEAIVLNNKSIELNAQAVSHTLGMPSGDTIIRTNDEDAGKIAFLSLFGVSEIPRLRFFGEKIMTESLEDDEFIRCFMTVALATFLCPTSSTKPSTKYMGALVDAKKIRELNWCKFVHDWLIWYIKKYQKQKTRQSWLTLTLGGCIYHLAVRCLDFTDFGSIILPTTLPRICFWKGQLIKNFNDMYVDKDENYRALEIKDESETCYADDSVGWASTLKNSNFRNAIERVVGDSFNHKVKEGIFISFQNYMRDENLNTCVNVKKLLLETLQLVTSAKSGSEETLKLEPSHDETNSSKHGDGSNDTIKVDSNGEPIDDPVPNKKRRLSSSQQSSSSKARNKRSKHTCDEEQQQTKSETHMEQEEFAPKFFLKKQCGEDETKKQTQEISSSLNYLLEKEFLVNKNGNAHQETDSNQNCNTLTNTYFDGFKNTLFNTEHPHAANAIVQSDDKHTATPTLKETQPEGKRNPAMDFDINVQPSDFSKFFLPTGEEQVPSESIEVNLSTKDHPLDEARKKYFFHDGSTPSFRLLADEDDCGNIITEPELWRPIGMGSQEYEEQIQEAKKAMDLKEQKGGCTVEFIEGNTSIKEPKKTTSSKDELESCTMEYAKSSSTIKGKEQNNGFLSIQCAQRDRTTSQPTSPNANTTDGIVDLTSPSTQIPSNWNYEQTCYYPMGTNIKQVKESTSHQCRKVFAKSNIIGRKLFPEEDSKNQAQLGTKNHPITVMDKEPVQILGEKFMNKTCRNMVNKSDEFYNTQLTMASASISSGKENILPKRIVQPSKFNSSPYGGFERFPIMEHEQRLYNNIITLSKSEAFKSKWAISINNVKLSMEQLGSSMEPHGWVEIFFVYVYCRKLFNDNHPRNSHRHYFFHTAGDFFLEKWKNDAARLSWREKLVSNFRLASKARELHLSDKVFFPTIHQKYWFLFVVDIKARLFVFLDSLYEENSLYHIDIKDKMIASFVSIWNEAFANRRMGFKNYGVAYPKLAQQVGGFDCSIFTVHRMENWCSRNTLQKEFKSTDVSDARVRLAVDLLFSEHNTIDDMKRVVKNF